MRAPCCAGRVGLAGRYLGGPSGLRQAPIRLTWRPPSELVSKPRRPVALQSRRHRRSHRRCPSLFRPGYQTYQSPAPCVTLSTQLHACRSVDHCRTGAGAGDDMPRAIGRLGGAVWRQNGRSRSTFGLRALGKQQQQQQSARLATFEPGQRELLLMCQVSRDVSPASWPPRPKPPEWPPRTEASICARLNQRLNQRQRQRRRRPAIRKRVARRRAGRVVYLSSRCDGGQEQRQFDFKVSPNFAGPRRARSSKLEAKIREPPNGAGRWPPASFSRQRPPID